jgi:hypothetical protein
MGYESLWFARNHYLDYEKRWNNKEMQMMWHTTDENTPGRSWRFLKEGASRPDLKKGGADQGPNSVGKNFFR